MKFPPLKSLLEKETFRSLVSLRAGKGPLTDELVREPAKFGLGQIPSRLTPDATTTMVCGFCSTGCGLNIQLKDGQKASREEILKFMDGKIAKWWMPDDVAFVDGIPHTATGKILKTALREQFKAYRFPNAAA